jgi:adenosylcobinamide-phosphate synthase
MHSGRLRHVSYNPCAVSGLSMTFLSLLFALLAQHVVPPPASPRLESLAGRLCLWLARRMDAGDAASGRLALAVLLVAACLPIALVAWLAAAIHPVASVLLDAVVLYGSLRFLETAAGPRPRQPVSTAIERALREAHHGTFALLFWFVALGAVGGVLHVALRRAAELWSLREAGELRPFGDAAALMFHLVDWLPQRASALGFAVVGNFEDAVYCWRGQAPMRAHDNDAVVLASGAGALGVLLAAEASGDAGEAMAPGLGEPPGEEALASLEGLLWRALVLWGIVIAVLTAIVA